MYNITLISTEHRESGKCNSNELCKIIEIINPDVIFEEEINDEKFQEYYNNKNSFNSLEVQAIKKYILANDIDHIPVDINVNFNFKEWDFMFGTFRRHDIYNDVIKKHCYLRDRYGFDYLNSELCLNLSRNKNEIEKQLIEFSGIYKNRLAHIYNNFHEGHQVRENAMITNIYNFSKKNKYNKAVFLIGYAHRDSIIKRVQKYEPTENLKLNWTFYRGKMA